MDDWEGEDQFLIRVPLDLADELRQRIKDQNFKDFKMSVLPDDKATLKVGKRELHGKMCQPPTYIESLKTYDKRNYYKSADIAQMAVFKDTEDEANCLPTHLNSGLTPATKRIRKRRARRNPINFLPNQVRDVETAIQQKINNSTEGAVTYETIEVTDDEEDEPAAKQQQAKKLKQMESIPNDTMSGATGLSGLTGLSGITGLTGINSEPGGEESLGGADSELPEDEGDEEEEEEEEEDEGLDDFAAEFEKEFPEEAGDDEAEGMNDSNGAVSPTPGSVADSSEDESDESDDGKADQIARQQKSLQDEIARLEHTEIELTNNLAFSENPIMSARFDDQLQEVMSKKRALEEELRALGL